MTLRSTPNRTCLISTFANGPTQAVKFKITAELIDADLKEVTLKKADGSTIKVPVSKLSKADRDWIKENY